jgi:GTP-binding protein TypA/BipA
MLRNDLRNIAIVAHVDHGKTTLVDEMLKQSGTFRENQVVADRVMDNNDLERERGITILAKNTSLYYKDIKINVVDTPGHADFGGEVERVLKMVNGVLLLVDAFEGTMPQTRFVLQKALDLGHKVVVVINKIDRPGARINEVIDEVLELLITLDANDEQLNSPVVFCSGRNGTASLSPEGEEQDLVALFETIVSHIPAPDVDVNGPTQMLVSSIDYNDYMGRFATGRIERGTLKKNQDLIVCNYAGLHEPYRAKAASLLQFDGLKRINVDEALAGDIVMLSGIESVTIGDTVCDVNTPEPLPFVSISEPTLEMTFSVNDSPFCGKEGKFCTSRHLRERLFRELLKDVSLRVKETDTTESFKISGRGEMHLSILIETMRREGYEFQVSAPKVLLREIDGVIHEPLEDVICEVPQDYMGSVMEKLGARKAEIVDISPKGDRMKLEFRVPTRGLFGYRNEFLTDTRGEGIISSILNGYTPYKGDIPKRVTGSLVAFETGKATTYGIFNAQDRGKMFIPSGIDVYEGMIVGESPKTDDICVNVCKKKHMTAVRSTGADEALRLVTPIIFSLEEAIEYINDDELIEITPKSIRLRKSILNNQIRAKTRSKI